MTIPDEQLADDKFTLEISSIIKILTDFFTKH
jgi:hypothetical protein